MKFLKFGTEMFSKKLFSSFLLILQLVFSIVAANIVISMLNSYRMELEVIEKIENKNMIHVSRNITSSPLDGDKYFEDVKSAVKEPFSVGEIGINSIGRGESSVRINIYSDTLAKNIHIPLSKGVWNGEIKNENGILYYPIVVYDEKIYKLGERISGTYNNKEKEINLYVCGVLNVQRKYFSMSTTSNVLSADMLFKTGENHVNIGTYCSFFGIQSLVPSELFDAARKESAKILFFDSDIGVEGVEKIAEDIDKYAMATTFGALRKNSMDNYSTISKYFTPLCLVVFFVSIVGIMSSTALNMLENSYLFSILFLSGCRWKDCAVICVSYTGVIVIFSLIGTFGLYICSWILEIQQRMNLLFQFNNLMISGLMILFVFLISMLVPFYMVKKYSITEYIRKFGN